MDFSRKLCEEGRNGTNIEFNKKQSYQKCKTEVPMEWALLPN